jgi:hypothetical protein
LSAKYASSSALQLRISKSRIRTFLHCTLCCCVILALLLVYFQGYRFLALLLSPPAALLLCRLRRDTGAAAVVRWQQGVWTVERNGYTQVVSMSPSSTGLPWVIYLAWRKFPVGGRESVWLFSDCAPTQQLRRLRVRLTLQR